ncbi:MAG: hypothetical protein M3460_13155 [Actinomycetota bacterium]|jgi:hypothetical protein|nr:hypothetical protein [Actinomycetota bacterium]
MPGRLIEQRDLDQNLNNQVTVRCVASAEIKPRYDLLEDQITQSNRDGRRSCPTFTSSDAAGHGHG